MNKQELKDKLNKLKKENKRLKEERQNGLVFDNHKEEIEVALENKIPYLKEKENKNIINNKENNNNLIIEGDNLHSLNIIKNDYKEQIDVIYIDPPYNTGKEFVYNDKKVDKNDSYSHSKWLSFMNKRLKLAKELLSEDGVIFVSIDDNEQAQLKLLMDKIFGERNFVNNGIRKVNPKKQKIGEPNWKTEHEYVLAYSKTQKYKMKYVKKDNYFQYQKESFNLLEILKKITENPYLNFTKLIKGELSLLRNLKKSNANKLGKILSKLYRYQGIDKGLKFYKYIDEKGLFMSNNINITLGKGNDYKIVNPFNEKKELNNPKYGLPKKTKFLKTNYFKENKNGNLVFAKKEKIKKIAKNKYSYGNILFKENSVIRHKKYLDIYSTYDSIITNHTGSDAKLMEKMKLDFDYPKRKDFIKDLIKMNDNQNATVLDFFAGSGTTGQAVLELNQEDGGNRNFILCTNNENSKSEGIILNSIYKFFLDKNLIEPYNSKIKTKENNYSKRFLKYVKNQLNIKVNNKELKLLSNKIKEYIDNNYNYIKSNVMMDKYKIWDYLEKQGIVNQYNKRKWYKNNNNKPLKPYKKYVDNLIPFKIINNDIVFKEFSLKLIKTFNSKDFKEYMQKVYKQVDEEGICKKVTYPRMKKVINGYVDNKGNEVEGLGGNLKYYKAEFKNI